MWPLAVSQWGQVFAHWMTTWTKIAFCFSEQNEVWNMKLGLIHFVCSVKWTMLAEWILEWAATYLSEFHTCVRLFSETCEGSCSLEILSLLHVPLALYLVSQKFRAIRFVAESCRYSSEYREPKAFPCASPESFPFYVKIKLKLVKKETLSTVNKQ